MKVTYLNNGIRYHRECDDICSTCNYINLIYHSPEGDSFIILDKKDAIIEQIKD